MSAGWVVQMPRACSFCVETSGRYSLLDDACLCETCSGGPVVPVHPDAALLNLCVQIDEMRGEWQRLWLLTSDGPALETEVGRAWQGYSDNVWPGVILSDWNRIAPGDVVGQLRVLRATTPEGLKAKAAAIMALENAATYCDCRNDAAQLWASVVEDAAGDGWPRVGEEAL